MNTKAYEDFCQRGEKADQLFSQGRYKEALDQYHALFAAMKERGHVDSYLASKVTLGVLVSYIKSGQLKKAHDVWNASMEDSFFGIGIYGLENAQVTVEDLLTYDFICAYLHSISEAPQNESADAVTQYMSRICEHSQEVGARGLGRMAVNNWKQHLREIFSQSSMPFQFAKPLINFEKSLGESIKPGSIEFPELTTWKRPHDFHEMSKVANFGLKIPHTQAPKLNKKTS
jgi:hypothetical protein